MAEGRRSQHCQEIIDSYSLLCWGANSYGQLGQGHLLDQMTPSTVEDVSFATVPHSITGGGGHTLVLLGDGSLCVCGSNSHGQLGLGDRKDRWVLTQVTFPTSVKVTQVSGGWDFTLACTADGELYSWGSNAFQQLGRQTVESHATVPGKVNMPEKCHVKCVASGLRHGLALADSGSVYVWGHNKKGQLGQVDSQGMLVTKVLQPVQLALKEKAVQIAAGSYHSAVLTEAGSVYLWGCNKYGQLGVDPSTPVYPDTRYLQHCLTESAFDVKRIHYLAAGWTHNIAVTDTGEVYSWGRGDYGQLGRSCDGSCDFIPRPVMGLHGVHHVACGSEHNLCLTDDGRLFSWGWNEHGMCGTGEVTNVQSPTFLPLPGRTLIAIGCGAGHSVAVFQCKSHR